MASAPLVAFYPLIIVCLGFGFRTVVAVIFALAVIPVAVNTLAGMRSVNPSLVRTVQAFGGGKLDVITKVMLPAAFPLVLAGVRIGVGRGLVGVVLGEMFSANAGLGFLMTYYGARLRTADLFAPLVVLMAGGVAATQAIRLLEHRMARWQRS
jgi:ABC-type nitrate/sulfonate/bicarbonate transport system permease component